MYKQDSPFAIQIELVEGCNLYCDFCGLQGIREKKDKTYKMMTEETIKLLGDQILQAGWNPRIEFAMHGEPTMHEKASRMIFLLRNRLPDSQIMMTSNGGGLLPDVVPKLKKLFKAGLNLYAFDAYEYVKIKEKVDEALSGAGRTLGFEVHRYPDEPDYSPHNRYGSRARLFIRVKDISIAERGTHSVLNNHCGAGSKPENVPVRTRCAKPFREISVRWDGSIAICCNDWRGVYKCGSIHDKSIEEIWQGDEFASARRFLIRGERAALKPCDICDAKSYRVGLLPDKFGKRKLREPNEEDTKIVRRASAGSSLTDPIIRPWEIAKAK